jgi:glycosyltransferase involved in cell wall biosynthesis
VRVALLSEYQSIGGGESNLLNLCEELQRHLEIVLFCDGPLYSSAVARGIACRRMNLMGKRWIRFVPLMTFSLGLARQLSKFDVVHAYSVNILPRLCWTRKPIVWTTHGYWERPFGLRARVIGRIADKIIAVSSSVFEIAEFRSDKKLRIYLGTKLARQVSPLLPNRPLGDKINIVSVGRFQRIKGQDLLLEAVRQVAISMPQAQIALRLVGDVNGSLKEDLAYKDSLIAQARGVGVENLHVHFEGFLKDVSGFIASSDFIVIPSRYESFSMVAIEALALGKPVIGPDIGGPKEIIDHPSIGLLFSPESVESLSAAIRKMIVSFDSFEPAGCTARAAQFSIENQAHGHLQLYRELCNG